MINLENPFQLNLYTSFFSHLSVSRLLKTFALFKWPTNTPPAPIFSLFDAEPLPKMLWVAEWISAYDERVVDSVKRVPHLEENLNNLWKNKVNYSNLS